MSREPTLRDRGKALVDAVRDVAPPHHPLPRMRGTAKHAALFTRFVDALTAAKQDADSWWNNLVDVEASRSPSRDEAVAVVWARHPGGPVTYGSITYVVRRYWLEWVSTRATGGFDCDVVRWTLALPRNRLSCLVREGCFDALTRDP